VSKLKILVVDDDEAVLEYLRVKIGARYDVIVTTASSQVMALARENQPQLVVCDLDMPNMNGTEVSAAMFGDEELRHIPLMFLTAAIAPQDIRRVRGLVGGRPAMPKNAPLAELIERIESMLATVA
jgi:CheY-like chemotaxis protein